MKAMISGNRFTARAEIGTKKIRLGKIGSFETPLVSNERYKDVRRPRGHTDKAFGNWDKKRSISEILGLYHLGPGLTTGPRRKSDG